MCFVGIGRESTRRDGTEKEEKDEGSQGRKKATSAGAFVLSIAALPFEQQRIRFVQHRYTFHSFFFSPSIILHASASFILTIRMGGWTLPFPSLSP